MLRTAHCICLFYPLFIAPLCSIPLNTIVASSPSFTYGASNHSFLLLSEVQSASGRVFDDSKDLTDLSKSLLLGQLEKTSGVETPMPDWLRPGRPQLPQPPAGMYPHGIKLRDHLGEFMRPHGTGEVMDPHGTESVLAQPGEPQEKVVAHREAFLLWRAVRQQIEKWSHCDYFYTMIKVAHPPALYVWSTARIPHWSPYTEAAIQSLIHDVGIPPLRLFTDLLESFTQDSVRESLVRMKIVKRRADSSELVNSIQYSVRDALKSMMKTIVDKSDFSELVDNILTSTASSPVATATPSTASTSSISVTASNEARKWRNTYAQIFEAEWYAYLREQRLRNSKSVGGEENLFASARELAEYVRIEAFVNEQEAKQNKQENPTLLYALPFLKQVRPRSMLKFLFQHLKAKKVATTKDGGQLSDFEKWVEGKQKETLMITDNVEQNILGPYVSRSVQQRSVLPDIIQLYSPSDYWQANPFRNTQFASFLGWRQQSTKSPMHSILSHATFSFTLLWLRRLAQDEKPGTKITTLLEAVVAPSSATAGQIKKADRNSGILLIANRVVLDSLVVLKEHAVLDGDEDRYKNINIDDVLKRVGGTIPYQTGYYEERLGLSLAASEFREVGKAGAGKATKAKENGKKKDATKTGKGKQLLRPGKEKTTTAAQGRKLGGQIEKEENLSGPGDEAPPSKKSKPEGSNQSSNST